MIHSTIFRRFLVLMFAALALFFVGCSNSSDDDDNNGPSWSTFSVSVSTGTKYYSLKTGEEVADPTSSDWDIAFEAGAAQYIYTNSGVSAQGPGGQGGVWFTDKAFDAVTQSDRLPKSGDEYEAEYGEFTEDVNKYVGTSQTPQAINVMTYLGYNSGSGDSDSDPYTTVPLQGPPGPSYLPYLYDKKHAVSMTKMIGGAEFGLTGQVYIIRHGDGAGYSKVEITEYTFSGSMAEPTDA
ncbi:MAG: HmuY family protein, partial [Treponema sp.]|nr:HmuY family protein [Treponema sp.]